MQHKAALYARYSTDDQRETSIEDQVRRCKEVAEKNGYVVPDELIFSDSAISGSAKELKKRVGYWAMRAALENGEFQCLVVDEISRIGRDTVELSSLQKVIQKTAVRLISTDGTDSRNPNWQFPFEIMAVINQNSLRETAHRVKRSMVGQLERGFMIAAPAFGYKLKQFISDDGKKIGSIWEIDEGDANIVREVYKLRRNGKSFAGIAKELNTREVKSPRTAHNGEDGFWRPGTIYRMLGNTIYRGVFIWNGSPSFAAKAKKEGWTPKPVEYYRPDLRLVDDDTWNFANTDRGNKKNRCGGGKHIFAGLIRCNFCSSVLTVSSPSKHVRTVYCATCHQKKNVAATTSTGPGYVSTAGIEALLRYILDRILDSEEVVSAYKERLRSRLTEGSEGPILELQEKVNQSSKTCARLAKMVADVGDNEHLEKECRLAMMAHKQLEVRLAEMKTGLVRLDKSVIERQLDVAPGQLANMLFGPIAVPERSRAIIKRLFPSILALGKSSRFVSHFEVSIVPGVGFAEVAGTAVVDEKVIRQKFEVRTTPHRPVIWHVSEM